MKLDKEKIKKVLLDHGLSTRRSERIAEDLASRDLTKEEKRIAEDLSGRDLMKDEKKKKLESKNIAEVIKE